MLNLIFAHFVVFSLFARAEFLSDADTEILERTIQTSLQEQFEKRPHYAGPKGLLHLKNCDRVQLESQSVGPVLQEASRIQESSGTQDSSGIQESSRTLSIPVTLSLKAGKKSDSIEVICRIKVSINGENARVFKFESMKFAEDQLSPRDHCQETRKNSRLFSSVQSREILRGMPEVAVRASWGEWKSKTPTSEGLTRLIYEGGREIFLRGGLVESWKQK